MNRKAEECQDVSSSWLDPYCLFIAIPIKKNPVMLWILADWCQKLIWSRERPRIANRILKDRNKVGRLTFCNWYKSAGIKTAGVGENAPRLVEQNRTRKKMHADTVSWSLMRFQRRFNGEESFQQMTLKQLNINVKKNLIRDQIPFQKMDLS